MTKLKDYSGMKFGKLTTLNEWRWKYQKNGNRRRQYLCRCECGREIFVAQSALTCGNSKSCGCVRNEKTIKRNKETASLKGASNHPHYARWHGMNIRCYYKTHKDYQIYGGRGIVVCKEWKDDPWEFYRWIEEDSNWEDGKNLSLDRIDPNGNYSPENCRFSDTYVQAINQNINKGNKSGYPGVSWDKNKWLARLSVPGERITLGRFDTKKEAIVARKKAESEYFGKILHPEVDDEGNKKAL